MHLAEVRDYTEPPISERTVRTYLEEDGYGRYVAKKVVFLTDAQKKARRDYGRMYRDEELDIWERQIFSDECYVYLGDKSGQIYVTQGRLLCSCVQAVIATHYGMGMHRGKGHS
jgi:hypothetical protein